MNKPFKRHQLKQTIVLNYLIYTVLQLTESEFFSSSIDDLTSKLNESLLSALNEKVPQKENIFRSNYKDWVNNQFKNIAARKKNLTKHFN